MLKLVTKFIVSIEGANFEFEKPKGNDPIRTMGRDDLRKYIFDRLRSVSGVQDESGADLGADQVRTLDLPVDIVHKIEEAFIGEYLKMVGLKVPDAEKKDAASA